jgi:phosphoribosyl 1,2-cyclic phosphodiesterase
MGLCFTVLGSGSSGNASLIQTGSFGLLLDAGLGPRQIASRLAMSGRSWDCIHAVLLTHTHSDHWKDRTFAQLGRRGIPLYCHTQHAPALARYSSCFSALEAARLVRFYEKGQEFAINADLVCRPLPVRHDDEATFGFRIACSSGEGAVLGYLADLGCWDGELLNALADVDLLALEFNHDVAMQYASGRSPYLIARILGDDGHLSNDQAAAFLHRLLTASGGRLRHVVQLHLSRDCNHPGLAREAAETVLRPAYEGVRLHTSAQHAPCESIVVGESTDKIAAAPEPVVMRAHKRPASRMSQGILPGREAS